MIKKLLKIAVAFGLLCAGHYGYKLGFAKVQKWIGTPRSVPIIPYDPSPSRTARETARMARLAFGPDHWSADPTRATWYYDTNRGYWIFFQNYKRRKEGKQIRVSPFALIWKSKDKKNLNTVLANEAYVDFDRPFDVNKPGAEPARIVHGEISGEVRLRDDNGTPEDQSDDLLIGPMTQLEYDEPSQQVRSESRVQLRQRDLVANATGLTIELRPNEPTPENPRPSGFSGAKTIWLHKQVHIAVRDVGKTGIVPGGNATPGTGEPRPGDLRCDGPAQIDLPKPRPKPTARNVATKGQPKAKGKTSGDRPEPADRPPDPIIAQFHRNVILRQGGPEEPDQLNADLLRLTLVPAPPEPKPTAAPNAGTPPADPASAPAAEPATTSEQPDGAVSRLVLRLAEATGHAVWLQSPSQGLKARGNQLLYERRAPVNPDRIYFSGDKETWIEHIERIAEGTDAGKIKALNNVWTKDVTIYQGLRPGDAMTLIADGPGRLETRAARDKPVDRFATWGDRLVVQDLNTAAGPRRRITLTGHPSVQSPTQGKIEAEGALVAYLKPRSDPRTAGKDTGPREGDTSLIDWVEAVTNVHMSAVPGPAPAGTGPGALPPGAKEIFARKKLDVVFAQVPAARPDAPPAAAPTQRPAAPTATPAPAPEAPPTPPAESQQPASDPATTEPAIRVEADEVWARLAPVQREGRPQLEEVRLRRKVDIRQDPRPNQKRGTEITADAVDLATRGEGHIWVEAHGLPDAPARVVNDTLLIEGPKLGLDQAADYAWVSGAGRLKQEATGEKPGGEKPGGEKPDAAPRRRFTPDGPVDITWTEGMQFFGRPTTRDGQPAPGHALFRGGVRVVTPESSLSCGRMKAYLDGPVIFQPRARAAEGDAPADPRIVRVHCLHDVELVHRIVDAANGRVNQKGRITGEDMVYDLDTGDFHVDGKGLAWVYQRRGARGGTTGPRQAAPTVAGQPVRPTAFQAEGPNPNRPGRGPVATNPARAGTRTRPAQGTATAVPALELTRIAFQKGVSGRVGIRGQDQGAGTKVIPFEADFLGGVQVMHAPVASERADLDADNPPMEFLFMASNLLKVTREVRNPPASRTADAAAIPLVQVFLDAQGDPVARDGTKAIFGDRITYDSGQELIYVYGERQEVRIVNQDGLGQPFSASRGRAVMYNRRSGLINLIDPKSFLLIDPRSGRRPRPEAPPRDNVEDDGPTLRPVPRVQPGDKERRGYSGS